MRRLARVLATAALVGGGLTLTGGAAEAAACSGTSGVTVVIDFGSSTSTRCAPDSSTAIAALDAVAAVTYPPQYPGTVVCQIDQVPSQPCTRMPPSDAYWAFFHAPRGGSWTYSSSGVASYDPPSGSVIGFAFGSGGAPSTPPPAASAPSPKPSSSSSSTSSRPRATSSSPRPRATSSTSPRPSGTAAGRGATSGATSTAKARPSTTGSALTTTTTGATTMAPSGSTSSAEQGGAAMAAVGAAGSTGSPTTLLAGAGLVALVGAAAAYLAVRRRRAQH